jgi:hypothetical protein
MSEGVIYPTKHSPKRLIKNIANLTRRSAAGGIPDAVAELYGISRASPVASPTFVFMVGSPGAGKSQGHTAMQESQGGKEPIFKSYNYAIINLDTLLESFVPFRIASSFGHSVSRCLGANYPTGAVDTKGKPSTKKFASIACYGSKAANLGAFGFIDHEETRVELLKALTAKMAERRGAERAAEYVEELFSLIGEASAEAKKAASAAGKSIMDLNEEAINYAISKHINIVYETTFGNIKKFNDLYEKLKGEGYKIVVFHISDAAEHIKAKLITRQEFEMPYLEFPFYRFVMPSDTAIAEYIKKTADVVTEIEAKSAGGGPYEGTEVYQFDGKGSFDPLRLKGPIEFDFEAQIERLIGAYGLRSKRGSAAAGCAATASGCAAAAGTKYGGSRRRYTRKQRTQQ